MHQKVSLLIFDEVHHCMKRHPYNQIMQDFYHKSEERDRPKIFGMTASPVWSGKGDIENLRALERNTDCTIRRVQKNAKELETHAYHPDEVDSI